MCVFFCVVQTTKKLEERFCYFQCQYWYAFRILFNAAIYWIAIAIFFFIVVIIAKFELRLCWTMFCKLKNIICSKCSFCKTLKVNTSWSIEMEWHTVLFQAYHTGCNPRWSLSSVKDGHWWVAPHWQSFHQISLPRLLRSDWIQRMWPKTILGHTKAEKKRSRSEFYLPLDQTPCTKTSWYVVLTN